MEGLPPLFILYNWRRYHPDFKKNLELAKRDRAEYYHDKAVEALKDAEGASKEEVPGAKLQFDGFLKLAEKGNPEAFSAKPQVLQGSAAPAIIVINTGINREPTTIEVNNEEICISGRDEDELRSLPNSERGSGASIVEALGAEIGND